MASKKRQEDIYSDLQLISNCKKGEVKCQELLYRRFFSFAMSIGIRYARNPEDAIEIVNDSFLKVFERLNEFDTSRPFKSWFARILVNTAIDSYRKNLKFQANVFLDSIPETNEQDIRMEKELEADDILKLFDELPDAYRVTFNLHEMEGYSHEEIGEMLGIAPSSSRSNLTRAKKMLRDLYSKHFNTVRSYNE
jgi:RNA polymerase sigma-70 factor (ECF subfamily)